MITAPVEVRTRKAYTNPDSQRVGENIRRWILRVQARRPEMTNKEIARCVGIHPSSLSRILRGYGVSERTLLAIATYLDVHPGRFLVGLEHLERYPNTPRFYDEPRRGRRMNSGRPLRRVEEVLQNPKTMSSFCGGIYDSKTELWVHDALWNIREVVRLSRDRYLQQNAGRLPDPYYYR